MVFIGSFILFQMPIEVVLYPLAITLFFLSIIVYLDIRNEYKQYMYLKGLKDNIDEEMIKLIKSDDFQIKEYQRIAIELINERRELIDNYNLKYNDMIDYYTMWTHQIKIPIASMKLKLDERDSEIDSKLNSDLNRIEQYVQMAINYLKLDNNDVDFVFKKCSLDKLIKEVIRKTSNDFIIKKISLNYEGIDKEILTDEKWFAFVLEQIISNAIKYTDKGYISIYLKDDELWIEDSGIGILPQDLPRVGEKGFTGFNGRNNKNASGLGLYLSKRILEKLNIEMKIDSKVNVGTTVKLNFLKNTKM